eukprot:TRINITY_DN1166_c1_g1_i3.p2 TRINITY_DN1166_c1_g1~~TRINITY_DN1166_c1_g1_i3.p2  ORF type:complete len:109 (+),score=0.53 TRINITY_DN1166_c1_g1_i3:725-1051(+)
MRIDFTVVPQRCKTNLKGAAKVAGYTAAAAEEMKSTGLLLHRCTPQTRNDDWGEAYGQSKQGKIPGGAPRKHFGGPPSEQSWRIVWHSLIYLLSLFHRGFNFFGWDPQ